MEKQHNQITTKDLMHSVNKLILSNQDANYIIQHLFWLQDSIISESYNFYAFNKVLLKHKLHDVDKAPFKKPYGVWKSGQHLVRDSQAVHICKCINHNLKTVANI